ncbi:S-adenosyl-L-methionine-dependent methyltransferase [Neurospora hispaniola]|uniref:S-adenosyl-L-methionine-dependent methyltransferase n=1 Tax=Neurospora hispaniola TaxID=588809 RepID=A0AAJ0I668_9PEZI|nr:S-adenosyl-L-methionine-dependent methyltransferase [Neurospora hispaniola]
MGSHSLPSASAADAVAKLAAAEALKSTAASAASAPGSSPETASGTAQGASAAGDAGPVTVVPSSDTPSVAVDPEAEAEAYERANVHNVYEAIAPHFSATRYKPWPAVAQFLHAQQPGYVGLDVGCGNGKYLGVNKNVFMVGSDRSANLVAHANERVKELQKPQQQQPEAEVVRARIGGSKKEKKHKQEVPTGGERESEAPNAAIGKETGSEVAVANDVLVADGLSLPFREGRADFAICIAVIHHMSTRTRRQEAIRQLLKCVRPGGQVMVYVWALEQGESRRGWDEGGEQDLLVPWVLKSQQPKPKKEKQPKASKQKQKWPQQQQQQQQQQQTHEQANTPMQQQNHDSTESQEAITAKSVGEKEATPTSSSILSPSSVPKDASMTIGGGTGAGVTEPASAAAAAVAGPDAKTDTGDAAANADAVFQRYYHLYRNGELEEDVLAARGAVVMSGYERDNWWVVATHATNDDTLQD